MVAVVCLNELDAVYVIVSVSVVVVGISPLRPVEFQSATTPASHAVCAADSLALELDTAVMLHGKEPPSRPVAVWR